MPSKDTKLIHVTPEIYEKIMNASKEHSVNQDVIVNACMRYGTNHWKKIIRWYRKKLKEELKELCQTTQQKKASTTEKCDGDTFTDSSDATSGNAKSVSKSKQARS